MQSIQDILARNSSVGIVVGKNPSIDDMGAALALYLSLKSSGKQVSIASPTDPIVEVSNLVGINKVKKSLDSEGGDLIVSFPYQDGEIEKVSYTLENGFLNIIVKAAEDGLSFSEKDVKYKNSGAMPSAIFVVGTPRLSDLGNLFDPELLKDTTIINIDNKKENQGFGEVVLVSSDFSSVSEQIGSLLTSLNYPIDADIAQNLLSGISFATENFQSSKTSPVAFEITAKLMQQGAKRTDTSIRPTPAPFSLASQKGPKAQPFAQSPMTDYSDPFAQGLDKSFLDQFAPSSPRPSRPFGQQMPRPSMPPRQPRQFNPSQQPKSFGGTQGDVQNKPFSQQPRPFAQPQVRPVQQPRVQSQQPPVQNTQTGQIDDVEKKDVKDEKDAPPDWLTPKVYKGSTLV